MFNKSKMFWFVPLKPLIKEHGQTWTVSARVLIISDFPDNSWVLLTKTPSRKKFESKMIFFLKF